MTLFSVDYCALGNTLYLRDRSHGLAKHAFCSLGFVRNDAVVRRSNETDTEWAQIYRPLWDEQPHIVDATDGEVYVKDVIDWFCVVVRILAGGLSFVENNTYFFLGRGPLQAES